MIEALTTRPAVDPAHARMRKQAEELEGVFLNTLVKEMFAHDQSRRVQRQSA